MSKVILSEITNDQRLGGSMRIGDQFSNSTKQAITPLKTTTTTTTQKGINETHKGGNKTKEKKLVNVEKENIPKVTIIASKTLPDKTLHYLVRTEGSPQPKWERREQLMVQHKVLVVNYEMKQREFAGNETKKDPVKLKDNSNKDALKPICVPDKQSSDKSIEEISKSNQLEGEIKIQGKTVETQKKQKINAAESQIQSLNGKRRKENEAIDPTKKKKVETTSKPHENLQKELTALPHATNEIPASKKIVSSVQQQGVGGVTHSNSKVSRAKEPGQSGVILGVSMIPRKTFLSDQQLPSSLSETDSESRGTRGAKKVQVKVQGQTGKDHLVRQNWSEGDQSSTKIRSVKQTKNNVIEGKQQEISTKINQGETKGRGGQPLKLCFPDGFVLPEFGHFEYGDKAVRITACRPVENDIVMDIEWDTRTDGIVPEKTAMSSKIVREFDHNLVIDFYEQRIKFTQKNSVEKKKQQQEEQEPQSLLPQQQLQKQLVLNEVKNEYCSPLEKDPTLTEAPQ